MNRTESSSSSSSSSSSESSMKKTIKIIQGSDVEQVEPIVVTIDTSKDKSVHQNAINHFLDKHVHPIQENFHRSIQTQMNGHVKPPLDKIGKTFQAGLGPQIDKVGQSFESLRSNTTSTIGKIAQSTKGVINEHIVPKIKKSSELGLFVTRKVLMEEIPTHTSKAIETVTNKTGKYADYYWNTAPSVFNDDETRLVFILLEASLMSFGQVVFCPNPVSGGLIFLAMLVGIPLVAISAVSCVMSSNFLMYYLDFDLNDIKKGYYGTNSVLVGAGCAAYLYHSNAAFGILYAILFSSILLAPMTLMMHYHFVATWLPKRQPPLLMVYNIIMIVILASAVLSNEALVVEPVYYSPQKAEAFSFFGSIFRSVLNGLSAIFLVPGHCFSGLIILVAVAICSRIIALSLLIGSFVGSVLGMVFGVLFWTIDEGIPGYEAALTTAAFAYYLEPTWKSYKIVIPAVIWTCMIQAAVGGLLSRILGVPNTLMLGFCLGTLSFLLLDTGRIFGLKKIPGDELTTPEEYLLKIKKRAKEDEICENDVIEVEKEKKNLDTCESKDESVATEDTPLLDP